MTDLSPGTPSSSNHGGPASRWDPATPVAVTTEVPLGASGTDAPGAAGTPAGGPSAGNRGPWQGRFWLALTASPRWAVRIALLAAAVLGIIGAAAELSGPTTYTSRAVMLIDDPYKIATAGTEGQLIKLEALRVKYSSLINTSAIAGPVAHQLGLPMGTVLQSVTGLVPLDSLLMDVDGTSSSAQGAIRLAQATADEVTAYVEQEDTTYGIPPADRFTFTVIDPAATATPSRPSGAHAAVAGIGLAVVGLILGFGATQLVRNRRLLR